MRWLLHGSVVPAVGEALKRHGHEATFAAEANLAADAAAVDVLEAARKRQLELMTADASVAEAPFALGKSFNRSIVHLNVASGDVEQDDAVDRLFERYPRLSPGRLYVVTPSRVKVRQLPAAAH